MNEVPRTRVIGRRALVRSGMTAAWTTPLVLLGVPARAAVCSGGFPTLGVSSVGAVQQQSGDGNSLQVSFSVQVCNVGDGEASIISATLSRTDSPNFEIFTALAVTNTSLSSTWAPASSGGSEILTVAAPESEGPPVSACASYDVSYTLFDGRGTRKARVTFDPSCGSGGFIDIETTVTTEP